MLFIVSSPEIEWLVSTEILNEYRDVLQRKKFKLPDAVKDEWLDWLDELTTVVDVQKTIDFPRDQKDAKFLSCAVSSGADYLITGDKDFGEARKLFHTTVISVARFKKMFCDNIS